MRSFKIILSLLLLFFVEKVLPLNFQFIHSISVGIDQKYITGADFNNDGNIDLVVGRYGNICILWGNGDGTFTAYPLNVPGWGVASGDFDGDGDIDIVAGGYHSDPQLLINDGNGQFSQGPTFHHDGYVSCIVSGRFNNGNIDDFAYVNYGDNIRKFSIVYFDTITHGYIKKDVPTTQLQIRSLIAGDFNNDGLTDIAAVPFGGQVEIFINQGGGNFSQTEIIDTGTSITGEYGGDVADFNNDGNLDLVVAYRWYKFYVFLGDGHGHFSLSFSSNYIGCESVKAGDFNNDGKIDLAASGTYNYTGAIYIFKGNGDGTFNQETHFSSHGSSPDYVVVADFNNDGKPDIGVGHSDSDNFSSFLNVFVSGDIDNNGEVDISDVILCLRMAIGLDEPKPGLADMNNDGEVDISDVILILRKAIGLD